MSEKRLTLTTDGLNRNGYRVLTAGIDLTNYQRNPVLLLGHDWGKMPVGKMTDIREENGTLTGLPVFDETNTLGSAIKSSFDNGFINACSIGFNPLETSMKPNDLKPGQKKATVTKCELLEVSLVPVPANPDAVTLSAYTDTEIPEVPAIQEIQTMEKTAKLLGLAADAGDDVVAASVQALQSENATLKADNQKATADAVLTLGASKGMVTDANRPVYEKLALSDPDSLKAIFDSAPSQQPAGNGTAKSLAAQIKPSGNAAPTDERADWDFKVWSQKDSAGLLAMKKSEPEKYASLAAAYKPA